MIYSPRPIDHSRAHSKVTRHFQSVQKENFARTERFFYPYRRARTESKDLSVRAKFSFCTLWKCLVTLVLLPTGKSYISRNRHLPPQQVRDRKDTDTHREIRRSPLRICAGSRTPLGTCPLCSCVLLPLVKERNQAFSPHQKPTHAFMCSLRAADRLHLWMFNLIGVKRS